MIYEIKDTNKISPLFGHWEETLIWSCLQGIMGKIYANDLTAPTAAMAVIGDFTFFAGEPCPELIAYIFQIRITVFLSEQVDNPFQTFCLAIFPAYLAIRQKSDNIFYSYCTSNNFTCNAYKFI